uniref:Uncharacterized protein n=1 Tax=Rhodosorus marinus TaxID=101924 RepID=A0A7S2ZHM9_9RHOD
MVPVLTDVLLFLRALNVSLKSLIARTTPLLSYRFGRALVAVHLLITGSENDDRIPCPLLFRSLRDPERSQNVSPLPNSTPSPSSSRLTVFPVSVPDSAHTASSNRLDGFAVLCLQNLERIALML